VHRTGTSGIETYNADDVTIQFNEVAETKQRAGGADSNGIDPDKATTRQVVQYNYTHDNGDGILLCQFTFGDVVVRYNVIARNTRYQIYLHSDPAARASVYNNTIYNDRSNYAIYGYGTSLRSSYTLTNNVIYSTVANAALTTSPTVHYLNNLYGGATLPVPGDDTAAVTGDPRFAAALCTVSGCGDTFSTAATAVPPPAATPVANAATASASAPAVLEILFQDNMIPPDSDLRADLVRPGMNTGSPEFEKPGTDLRGGFEGL
jgi:hypothetical protein